MSLLVQNRSHRLQNALVGALLIVFVCLFLQYIGVAYKWFWSTLAILAATWTYRQWSRTRKWFLQVSDGSHQLLVTVGGPGARTECKMDLAISLADVVEVSTVSYEIT